MSLIQNELGDKQHFQQKIELPYQMEKIHNPFDLIKRKNSISLLLLHEFQKEYNGLVGNQNIT